MKLLYGLGIIFKRILSWIIKQLLDLNGLGGHLIERDYTYKMTLVGLEASEDVKHVCLNSQKTRSQIVKTRLQLRIKQCLLKGAPWISFSNLFETSPCVCKKTQLYFFFIFFFYLSHVSLAYRVSKWCFWQHIYFCHLLKKAEKNLAKKKFSRHQIHSHHQGSHIIRFIRLGSQVPLIPELWYCLDFFFSKKNFSEEKNLAAKQPESYLQIFTLVIWIAEPGNHYSTLSE